MQTQTLKIQIPDGFMIDSLDAASGELKIKPKPKTITERIKNIADLLSENGLTQNQFDQQCAGLSEDEVAYRLIKMLVKSLNEGWTPDWDNDRQPKYYPWFYLAGGSSGFRFLGCANWVSTSTVGSRLCFKSSELCEHAAKHFTEVYKKFMTIN